MTGPINPTEVNDFKSMALYLHQEQDTQTKNFNKKIEDVQDAFTEKVEKVEERVDDLEEASSEHGTAISFLKKMVFLLIAAALGVGGYTQFT